MSLKIIQKAAPNTTTLVFKGSQYIFKYNVINPKTLFQFRISRLVKAVHLDPW